MRVLKLRNGSEEAEMMVKVVHNSFGNVFRTDPILAYELAMLARNPRHEMFGKTAEKAISLNMLEAGGKMHDSVRNVIVSSVEGEELEMKLVSPLAPGETW